MKKPNGPGSVVREIKRKTRRKYSFEEKIHIVLKGLRGEESIAELCRQEEINPNLYCNWSKEFLEAGKKRLKGDAKQEAASGEVLGLRSENYELKQLVADLSLELRKLKKSQSPWKTNWTNGEIHTHRENGDHSAGGRIQPPGEANAGGV